MKFKSEVQLEALNNATVDTDKFLVSDSSTIKYRTGAEVLSDIGAAPASGSGNYIQNQIASAQSANMWISGKVKVVGDFEQTGNNVFVNTSYDMYLQTNASGTGIIFRTSGATERMRITSAGNIGIGTSSPTAKLQVIGAAGKLYIDDSGVGYNYYDASNAHNFRDFAGTSRLYINTSSGNVGIGTTNPSSVLHLYRNSTTSPLNFSNSSSLILQNPYGSAGNTGTAIFFKSDVGTYNTFAGIGGNMVGSTANGSYGDIVFGTKAAATDTALSERMRINASGNVGIGTTSPGSLLHMVGTSPELRIASSDGQTTRLGLYEDTAGTQHGGYIQYVGGVDTLRLGIVNSGTSTDVITVTDTFNVGIGTTSPNSTLSVGSSDAGAVITSGGANTHLSLKAMGSAGELIFGAGGVSNGTAGSERMRITSVGNVGIGTSSPSTKLEVQTGGSTESSIRIRQLTYNYWDLKSPAASTDFTIGDVGGEKVRITSTGNVGIGTSSPSAKLDVNGSVRFTNGTNPYLALYDGTSTSYLQVSGGNLDVRVGGANAITFNANSAERMRITSGGNVYVNATSGLYSAYGYTFGVKAASGAQSYLSIATPSQTLDSEGLVIGVNADDASIILRDNKPLDFWTNNTNRMRITSAGNVGIGTTSPNYKLTVNDSGAAGYSTAIGLYNTYNTAANRNWAIGLNRFSYGDFSITTSSTQNGTPDTTRFLIDPLGNVGIGTTSPLSKLHVSFTSDDDGLRIQNSNRGNSYLLNTAGGSAEFFSLYDLGNSQYLSFSGNTGHSWWTQGSEKMRITSDGNVGIGTTSPGSKLDVNGTFSLLGGAGGYWLNGVQGNSTPGGNSPFLALVDNNTISSATYGWLFYDSNADGSFNLYRRNGSTTGNQVLTISRSTGNVGIGTTSPGARLTIQTTTSSSADALRITDGTGTINIGHWDTFSNRFELSGKPTYFVQYGAGNSISFGTLGSENMRVAAGGNVGIGTTSPDSYYSNKFVVRCGAENGITIANTGTTGTNYLMFADGTSGDDRYRGYVAYEHSPNNLLFATNASEKMRITSSGNVGIGTSSPSEKLEVNGSIRLSDGNADGPQLKLASSGYSDWNLDNYNGSFRAYYGSSEYFRITDVGNVGIGTTTPSTNLEVVGTSSSVTPSIRIKQDLGPSYMAMDLICDLFAAAGIIDVGNYGNTIFRRGSSESMRIDGDGYIGINTSTPNARLHLRETNQGQRAMTIQINEDPLFGCGLINFENNSGSNIGSIFYNGSSTSYNTSSDYRLKENVVKMDGALERLKLLKPVNFNFINRPDITVDGFIAHEVQEVIPEAIVGVKDELDKYGKPKYQGIDHSKIVPLLTAALQEAIDKISQLEERIQKLENK